MVNNSTPQDTVSPVVTTSDTSIYLKKSELPKNISSFRNDVGYISSSALDTWLKEHSYLSKNEINSLIRKANLVVIDTVNKSYDDDALNRLNEDIIGIKGEIVAIKDRINDFDGEYVRKDQSGSFVKKTEMRTLSEKIDELSGRIDEVHIDTSSFATKDSVPVKVSDLINDSGYLTSHQSLKGYVRKSELPDFDQFVKVDEIDTQLSDDIATKKWVEGKRYITEHQSLKGYVKREEIDGIRSSLDEYVRKEELPSQSTEGLATIEWVEKKKYLTKHQSLDGYAKKTDIPDVSQFLTIDDIDTQLSDSIATKDWVENKKYLTKHQSLDGYVKKNEIPSIDGLASEEWVEQKGYITAQALNGYALESKIPDVSRFVKKTDIERMLGGYLLKSDIPSEGLVTEDWIAQKGYLTAQSLEGYALESKIPDVSKFVKKNDLESRLSDYALRDEIPSVEGLATEKWVKDRGYVTGRQVSDKYVSKTEMSGYAKMENIPDLEPFASKDWVLEQGYVTRSETSSYVKTEDLRNSLSKYATKQDLGKYAKSVDVYKKNEIDTKFLPADTADEIYIRKDDVTGTYIRRDEAYNKFLMIEDYRGLKDASVISNSYIGMTLDEFRNVMESTGVRNGFYIVNGQDIVVVKDNSVISMFKDGVPQPPEFELCWEWED